LLKHPDYTENPAKIYDFGNCKATATVNKRRKLGEVEGWRDGLGAA
jgi:hypothetical protein